MSGCDYTGGRIDAQTENRSGRIHSGGGRGTRMGGRQKLYLQYQGKYLSLWTMEILRSLENFYISVAEIPEETVGSAGWITDFYEEAGPLGGIMSGLLLCP